MGKPTKFDNELGVDVDVYYSINKQKKEGVGPPKKGGRKSKVPANGKLQFEVPPNRVKIDEFHLIVETAERPVITDSEGKEIEGVALSLGSSFVTPHHIQSIRNKDGTYQVSAHFKGLPYSKQGPEEHVDPKVKHPDGTFWP